MFSIENGNFIFNGKKDFLNSGEIHYFRIRRELWDIHLAAACDAGLDVVSTYIPWAWHEPEEGFFDFNGNTCPERDLEGWLQRCADRGLKCIVKPGPFILAEFRGAGLPDWFLDRYHDQVKMRNSRGEIVASDGVSLFNDAFLEKTTRWYDRVMPLISRYQDSAGGPVIMMQICNEIGVFSWLAHQADYGNKVRERFIACLAGQYADVAGVNGCWGTTYGNFTEVQFPPDGSLPYTSRGDLARDRDWHRFWRKYYGDYLRMLAGMARERGVTLPLYHNLPGWIYGHGYEFPVNITMYDDLYDDPNSIVFGVDHIPEFQSHRNMHDDRIINDITAAMQANKPLFAAEFQSGSREYHVVPNPRETELFCKASLANGLTGWNHYMFSQGRNPERKGYSGGTFYWFCPLTAEGGRTGAFDVVRRMSHIVSTLKPIIVDAVRRAGICAAFYPPYYATELERPAGSATGLHFPASAIRRPAWFDGLLKALQVLNIDYDMADLTRATAESLERYSQLWVLSTDEMDASTQETIVNYIKAGGQCILFPYLPDRDMFQRPCTIIRDALGIHPAGAESIDSPLVDLLGMKDIKCANPLIIYDEAKLNGAEVIARTITGKACGFRTGLGRGTVIHLGTWLGFDTEGHRPAYETLLTLSGATLRQATADNEFITVRERFTSEGPALLFAGNYYNEALHAVVTYTYPGTSEQITIPYAGNRITWPSLHAILTPLCLQLTPDLKILHCTSDILAVSVLKKRLRFTLYGDRDLPGEIVFEGPGASLISSVASPGKKVVMAREGDRKIITYSHKHGKEMILYVDL